MATAIDTSKETHADVAAAEVLRRFVGYYKPYKALFFADLAAACILAGVDLAFPQLLNFFTREFFTESPSVILGSLGLIALLFIALYAARTGCQWFITYWGHVMGARMEADMRRDLFEQYQRLSFGYYDRHNTGVMMSKITTDLFDISELAHHGPENLFICTLKIVGSFVLLFMINGPLTAIMLVVTIVMAALSFALNYWRRRIFRENRERMAGINAAVQDSLGGIRVVKSFGGEDAEREKFRAANEAFLDTKNRSYKFMGAFHGLNSLFTGLLYTIVVVGGGYFVAAGTLVVTDLAIYALYVGIFMAPVEQLINFTETLQKGYAGFRRFIAVLAERPDVATKPGAPTLAEACGGEVRGAVDYRDVTFSYDGTHPVLDGLTLSIPAGTSVALVGPSGGGKTTTCSLLPRFYDVAAGAVTIDGVDVRDVQLASLREAIGIVQQDVYLFGGTVGENIAYGRPGATQAEIEEAARKANIHEFICSLPDGYDTLVGERGARLSGGQKQRISIARALLKDAPIVVLDEATASVDPENEQLIQQAIGQLTAGKTVVVIAHRLATVEASDQILVVDGGTVAQRGTHDQLMAEGGTYRRFVEVRRRAEGWRIASDDAVAPAPAEDAPMPAAS